MLMFVSEALSIPFDEGVKNVAFSLAKYFEEKQDVIVVAPKGNNTDGLRIEKIALNRFFISRELKEFLNANSPGVILYLSRASYSMGGFFRTAMLKKMCSSAKVVLLGVQHKACESLYKKMLVSRFMRPDLLLVLKSSDVGYFEQLGVNVRLLPPAVDNNKFYPATIEEKRRIRKKNNIPTDKTIVLHVGHIKTNRNVESLLDIQKINDIQVVIVGSTSIYRDDQLKDKLQKSGVYILDHYIQDMSEIYGMSDIYVFPVISETGAIDMPLSVLEAMACDLPVASTRFGGLADFFTEDQYIRYYDSTEELKGIITAMKDLELCKLNNRKKVEHFTWDNFADEIIKDCGDAV